MKKGCLIGIAILAMMLVIVAISLVVIFYAVDRRAGLSEAPAIPWTDYVTVSKETAVQVEVKVPFLIRSLRPALEKVPFPKWVSLYGTASPAVTIENVLPYTLFAALNIRPDLTNGNLTVFVNERRFGKVMAEMLTYDFLSRTIPQVKWNTEGAILHQRGALTLDGTIPIPADVEPIIQEKWPAGGITGPLSLDREPMISACVDNRAGQLVAIAGMILTAQDQDFKALAESGYGTMVMGLLPEIHTIHFAASLTDADTAKVTLRAETTPNGQSLFLLLSGFWPMVPQNAQTKWGLTVEGEPAWDAAQHAIVADLKVTGIENLVVSRLTAALAGRE